MERCERCLYIRIIPATDKVMCIRYPPAVIDQYTSAFPVISRTKTTCGEYRPGNHKPPPPLDAAIVEGV